MEFNECPRKPISGNAKIFHIAPTTFQGIRPEFVDFSKDGIPVKVLKVNNVGRHKIIDVKSNEGLIKILSNTQDTIPDGSAFVTFNQKYTYAYEDDWIIE